MAIRPFLHGIALAAVLMPVPAHAGWREDLGVFRIGMVASQHDPAGQEGSEAIRAGFSSALGMPVEIFRAKDYAVLVDAQASGRIQYAIHTATSYAAAALLCSCVEPLAAPVAADGSFGIRSVLVARADGPATADSVTMGRVAFGPADSVTGSLLPLSEFRPGGTAIEGTEDYLVSISSAEEAEQGMVAGKVSAMFGFVRSTDDPDTAMGGTPERLRSAGVEARVLWTSPLLRNGPHAVRSNLPSEAREMLADYLVGLRDRDPALYDLLERSHSGGFVKTRAEDYASALALVRRIGAASE